MGAQIYTFHSHINKRNILHAVINHRESRHEGVHFNMKKTV